MPRVARLWSDAGPDSDLHRRIDGSMVFVDVSGFTVLSERLGRLGKVGAEHVAEVIGTRFDRLLADAYDHGAELLKFGGDALLLFFSHPGHECDAVAAASTMHRTLRSTGRFTTEDVTVTLGMSAAVHSGGFDFFLVGGSHRELIVAGPAASTVVALEGVARRGQTLLGPETAAALPTRNVGPVAGPGRILRGSFRRDPTGVVPFATVDRDPAPLVPLTLREVLAADDDRSEHRRVTMAFIQFGGTDELVGRAPATAARALDELVRTVQDAIEPRGVCFLASDVAKDGGKIILTAGAPTGQGDDEEQMLLALRDIVERRPSLPLRIGANTGHVFAGGIGTTFRRTYTVMGDSVNLAARVMAHAEYGQILTTSPVLDSSRTLFEIEALDPFLVKGKRHPVTAFAVGPARGARAEVATEHLPLVGREDELDELMTVVDALPRREGGLVEISGEAGSGKSRLFYELTQRAGDVAVWRAQCRLYQAATPYFPVRQLLEQVLGVEAGSVDAATRLEDVVAVSAPHLLPWLSLLGVPLLLDIADSRDAAQLDEAFRKQRLEQSVVELLEATVRGPTILCFEDTHWMDASSWDVVRAIAHGARRRPWLVCATRRPGTAGLVLEPETVAHRVVLEPLGAAVLEQLVAAATHAAPLPGHVTSALVGRCDGNPLFLLELLGAFQETRDLAGLPSTVEGLLSARVDRLASDDRDRLRRLSVLGIGFDRKHLAAVDADDIAPDFTLTRLRDFLSANADGWITFHHALVRDVAYAGLPFRTRKRLHGQIAESILADADGDGAGAAGLLSLHFLAAGLHDDAWRYALTAGDAAKDLYANVEAATFYDRALLAARNSTDVPASARAAVLESLGDVQDRIGLYAESRSSFAAARRLLDGDAIAAARILLKESFVAERRGRYSDAVRAVNRGTRAIEDVDGPESDKLRAELLVWLAAIRASQGAGGRALIAARDGLAWAERVHADEARAQALLVLDYAEEAAGHAHDWHRTIEALDIYVRLEDLRGEASAANLLGAAAYFGGRWADALSWYTRSRAARARLGDPVNVAMADANIAEILTEQGRFEEAGELLRDAGSVFSSAGDPWGVAFTQRLRGLAAVRTGRFDEAEQLLAAGLATFDRIGARFDVNLANLGILELLIRRGGGGPAALALAKTLTATAGAPEQLGVPLARLHGIALVQTGDLAAAFERLDHALDVARSNENDYDAATSLDALAQAGAALGIATAALRAEADGIFGRLGVIPVADYPFGSTTFSGT